MGPTEPAERRCESGCRRAIELQPWHYWRGVPRYVPRAPERPRQLAGAPAAAGRVPDDVRGDEGAWHVPRSDISVACHALTSRSTTPCADIRPAQRQRSFPRRPPTGAGAASWRSRWWPACITATSVPPERPPSSGSSSLRGCVSPRSGAGGEVWRRSTLARGRRSGPSVQIVSSVRRSTALSTGQQSAGAAPFIRPNRVPFFEASRPRLHNSCSDPKEPRGRKRADRS
jgi:hypothetical protein